MQALEQLRAFTRYRTHGGYTWAAVMCNGDLLCEQCVRAEYRTIYAATRDPKKSMRSNHGDVLAGLTNSGESETTELCAGCNKILWENEEGE